MNDMQHCSRRQEHLVRSPKRERVRSVFSTVVMVVISIVILLGGYLLYRYFFPSDKALFFLAHYHTYQDTAKAEKATQFARSADISCSIDDNIFDPQVTKALNSVTVHTGETRLSDTQNAHDFTLFFMGSELLTTQSVTDGATTVFSSPQMADAAFSGSSTGEILNVLFPDGGIGTGGALTDGIDTEGLFALLRPYGVQLYRAVPDTAFSSEKKDGVSTVKLSATGVQLFSNVLKQACADSELQAFLYAQREQFVKNLNEIYAPSSLLVSSVTPSAFEKSFAEAVDALLSYMARTDTEVEITAVINQHRKIERETLQISCAGTPVFSLHADGETSDLIIYRQNGSVLLSADYTQKKSGTNTETAVDVSYHVTTEGGESAVCVFIDGVTETDVSDAAICLPENAAAVSDMDEATKQTVAQNVNERLNAVLTRAALGFLLLQR